MKTKHVVLAASVSVLVSVLSLWFVMAPGPGANGGSASAAVAGDSALYREHATTVGNPNARVHIVEFLDPACEACRAFYPFVKKMMADNPDRIRLSERLIGFHQGADFAVKALEASKLQGKFWPVLERLLASQPRWAIQHGVRSELVWEEIKTLDLDLDRLRADMDSPAVARNVALDERDAKAMKVTKTPEYFVNGKGLATFGHEQLQRLASETLVEAYR